MALVTIGRPDKRGVRVDVSFENKADAERVHALRWVEPDAVPKGAIRVRNSGGERLSLADIAFAHEAAIRVASAIMGD